MLLEIIILGIYQKIQITVQPSVFYDTAFQLSYSSRSGITRIGKNILACFLTHFIYFIKIRNRKNNFSSYFKSNRFFQDLRDRVNLHDIFCNILAYFAVTSCNPSYQPAVFILNAYTESVKLQLKNIFYFLVFTDDFFYSLVKIFYFADIICIRQAEHRHLVHYFGKLSACSSAYFFSYGNGIL